MGRAMEEACIRCTCRFVSLWLMRNACTRTHIRQYTPTQTHTHTHTHTHTLRECIPGYVCTACCNAVANTPAPSCPIRQSALNTSGTMPIVARDRCNVMKVLTKN